MSNRTIWLCTLAVSLAAISVSLVPAGKSAVAARPVQVSQLTPVHSLTGISFHAVTGY